MELRLEPLVLPPLEDPEEDPPPVLKVLELPEPPEPPELPPCEPTLDPPEDPLLPEPPVCAMRLPPAMATAAESIQAVTCLRIIKTPLA